MSCTPGHHIEGSLHWAIHQADAEYMATGRPQVVVWMEYEYEEHVPPELRYDVFPLDHRSPSPADGKEIIYSVGTPE